MEVDWEGELSQTQCRRIRNRVAKRKSRQKQQDSQGQSQMGSRDASESRPRSKDSRNTLGQSYSRASPHDASSATNWMPPSLSAPHRYDEQIISPITQLDIDAAMESLQTSSSNNSELGFAPGWELLGQPDGSDVLVQAPRSILDRSETAVTAGLQMPQLHETIGSAGAWLTYGSLDASNMSPTNGSGQQYETFLHRAIAKGRSEIVAVLLQNGADPNARGPAGLSPLHVAIREKQRPIIKTLLAFYGDIRAADDAGVTPLDLAIDTNDEESVRLLVEGGALLYNTPGGE